MSVIAKFWSGPRDTDVGVASAGVEACFLNQVHHGEGRAGVHDKPRNSCGQYTGSIHLAEKVMCVDFIYIHTAHIFQVSFIPR